MAPKKKAKSENGAKVTDSGEDAAMGTALTFHFSHLRVECLRCSLCLCKATQQALAAQFQGDGVRRGGRKRDLRAAS